jgi:6-phosphogluconolactonase
MKFSKLSQIFLVSTIGLLVAACLSGCQLVSIDYVYVACSAGSGADSAGQIEVYAADAASGALRPIDTPVASGGDKPVALALTSDYANLYVANQSNNSVVHFIVNDDGSLTQKDSVTTATTPVSLAVNATGTYLYVVSGTTSATLTEYSLSSGAIGSMVSQVSFTIPGYEGDTVVPTAVDVLSNGNATLSTTNGVYVTAYDQSAYNPGGTVTSSANPGWIFGYTVGSGGALTTVAGSPYQAGVKPTAIISDPTNRFIYATDFASNQLIGYTIASSSRLAFMIDGPFPTGNEPDAVVIDPRGIYMYVANALQSSVGAFNIALPTGTPSTVVSPTLTGTNTTDTDPVSISVDPALGRFVYTANYLGNSISGFLLDPNTGALSPTQATPYPTGANPTALVVVPHGNHAVQSVTP